MMSTVHTIIFVRFDCLCRRAQYVVSLVLLVLSPLWRPSSAGDCRHSLMSRGKPQRTIKLHSVCRSQCVIRMRRATEDLE
jgi:hypothetical protein